MSHIKNYRCLSKVIYQIHETWKVGPFSNFYHKIWVGFCLNTVTTTDNFESFQYFKVIYQIHETWKVGSFSNFYHKIWVGFCLNTVTTTDNFESFQYFNFQKIFWKTNTFFKKLEYRFLVKKIRLKTQHFHTKLSCQKAMLRQIDWEVPNKLITKNGFLPLHALFFWKFCFSIRTS